MRNKLDNADFYIGYSPNARWIGSMKVNGSIWTMPANILVQNEAHLFETVVEDFLKTNNGYINEQGHGWPWIWADSRQTDYIYMFIPDLNKVGLSVCGDIIVDPVRILQGEDMKSSSLNIGVPLFPLMRLELIPEKANRYFQMILNRSYNG